VLAKLGFDPRTMPMKPMSVEQCVSEGLSGLLKNRSRIVPGRLNRIMNALVPASLARKMEADMLANASRTQPVLGVNAWACRRLNVNRCSPHHRTERFPLLPQAPPCLRLIPLTPRDATYRGGARLLTCRRAVLVLPAALPLRAGMPPLRYLSPSADPSPLSEALKFGLRFTGVAELLLRHGEEGEVSGD
jgi:hypothetical protein